jgi:hypothetical protein
MGGSYVMRKLVLWGHGVDEYREMFDLTTGDMKGNILEYGCGASLVNSELHHQSKIASFDPLFNLDKEPLQKKVSELFEDMLERVTRDQDKFDFSHYGSFEALVATRREGMKKFFADYEQGKLEKRYQPIGDNTLPFSDFEFDFALSSHYLFAELDGQDVDFHLKVIRELARAAKEVRIFPLINRYGRPSPFLGPVLLGLQQDDYGTEVRNVSYSLQPKGNAMLRVWAQQCRVI